jgi:hypothetical protein
MNEPLKAARVYPPEPDIVEVNMTKLYGTVAALVVASAGLTASNVFLWRKTKKNREYVEALGDYVSKLVTETSCGSAAYKAILEEAEGVTQAEVDWSTLGSFGDTHEERRIRVDDIKGGS